MELHSLLLKNSMWVVLRPTELCEQWRVVRQGLRFIVPITEDWKSNHLRV